jgi:hypothetical protein
MFVQFLLSLIGLGFLFPSSPVAEEASSGFLEITFQLNPAATDEFVPSYQTVVWLETLEGDYVRSLLVSEYMSYGGFMLPEVCSRWHNVSNWEENYEQEMDAVTAATPKVERSVLTFDCEKEELAQGSYRYCVQTHIVEDYNILFTGEIRIGGEENESMADVTFTPSEHPDATTVLEQVTARFYY